VGTVVTAETHPPHILVVDDERSEAQPLIDRLAEEGWRGSFAAGGREAIEFLRHSVPDAVICDLRMPEVGGYDVLRAVGLDPRTRNIVFILININEDWTPRNFSRIAARRSADTHLCKPWDGPELKEVVNWVQRIVGYPREIAWVAEDIDAFRGPHPA
jgi:CheY-like chemotaxis protein